jgi:hypothetical protein
MIRNYDPVWKCIYCGNSTSTLGKEHIVPFSLFGTLVLPRSSCDNCGKLTSQIERIANEKLFHSIRLIHNFPSRKPGERPTCLTFQSKIGTVLAPISNSFGTYPIFKLNEPGFLINHTKFDFDWVGCSLNSITIKPQDPALFKQFNSWTFSQEFDINTYAKLMVKIAHGFASAELDIDNFDAWIPDILLNNKEELLPYVVGSLPNEDSPSNHTYELNYSIYPWEGGEGINHFIQVKIRLFAYMGGPTTTVIVGTTSNEGLDRIRKKIERNQFLNMVGKVTKAYEPITINVVR